MIAASLIALAFTASPPGVVAQATPSITSASAAAATATVPPTSATAKPALGPTASPLPTPTATNTPIGYGYRFVPRQPDHVAPGQPQIFAVYLNDKRLRSHGPIRIKVTTSPDVVKVVSRSNGREGNLALVSAGDFEATSVLPKIPFIAAGMTVDLEFIATGPDGRKISVRVPVRLE